MNLKGMRMLRERRQFLKVIYILSDSIFMTFWKNKNCSENRVVVTRGWNGGECDYEGTTGEVLGMMKLLCIQIVVMVS